MLSWRSSANQVEPLRRPAIGAYLPSDPDGCPEQIPSHHVVALLPALPPCEPASAQPVPCARQWRCAARPAAAIGPTKSVARRVPPRSAEQRGPSAQCAKCRPESPAARRRLAVHGRRGCRGSRKRAWQRERWRAPTVTREPVQTATLNGHPHPTNPLSHQTPQTRSRPRRTRLKGGQRQGREAPPQDANSSPVSFPQGHCRRRRRNQQSTHATMQ